MTFGATAASRSDIEFTATTGPAKTGIEELRATFAKATAGMSEDAIKLAAAQERADNAIIRSHGRVTSSTLAAELNLRHLRETNTQSASGADAASAAFRREGTEIERVGRGALVGSGLVRGLGRAAAFSSTAFLGGAGLVYAVKEFTKAAEEHQVTEGQLRAALTAQGISYAAYRGQIDATLRSQEQLTGFSESETTAAFTKLVRTTGDVGKALHLTAVAADIARGSGKSLTQTSDALNKAFGGSVTALKLLGVELPKGAKGYQAIQIAAQRFAGDAAAQAKTVTGAQERATIAIHQTEVAIGDDLIPVQRRLSTEIADYLNKASNQRKIQRDVNTVIKDGTQIVHGLVDAEKLIAPPIKIAIGALGGLEHAVELALVAGLALKAKSAATSLGLIQTASARARTQIVEDAALEERALGGVAASAGRIRSTLTRTIPIGRGGKGGGAITLAALLFGSSLLPSGSASSNLQGAATYGFLGSFFGPEGAAAGAGGYELYKGVQWLTSGNASPASSSQLQQLAQAAASGKATQSTIDFAKQQGLIDSNEYAVLSRIVAQHRNGIQLGPPQPVLGPPAPNGSRRVPGALGGSYTSSSYLSPAQKRANALAANPNSLGALGAQVTYDKSAIEFLKKRFADGKVDGKAYSTTLQALYADELSNEATITSIEQTAADKIKAEHAKQEAAAKRKADEAKRARAAAIREAVREASQGLKATLDILNTRSANQIAAKRAAAKRSANELSLGDAILQNALASAQLDETRAGSNAMKVKAAQEQEIRVYQAILEQERAEGAKLGKSSLAYQQNAAEQLATQQAIAQIRSQASPAAGGSGQAILTSLSGILQQFASSNTLHEIAKNTGRSERHLQVIRHTPPDNRFQLARQTAAAHGIV